MSKKRVVESVVNNTVLYKGQVYNVEKSRWDTVIIKHDKEEAVNLMREYEDLSDLVVWEI